SLEHEVTAAEAAGHFDGPDIGRALQHTQECIITPRVITQLTDVGLAQCSATAAIADTIHRRFQHMCQVAGHVTITLEQVQSHALGSLRPDTGQAAQRINQLANQGTETHTGMDYSDQNGILKPSGRFMPAVMPAIFSWFCCSSLRTASLNAAAIRSSSTSFSSLIRLSSIATRRTS